MHIGQCLLLLALSPSYKLLRRHSQVSGRGMEGLGVDMGEQAMSGASSGTRASYCTYKVQTCCGYSEVEEDTKGLRVRHRGLLLLGLCLWWHFPRLFVRLSSKTRPLATWWRRRLKAQQRTRS